jgi:hypothetical protein
LQKELAPANLPTVLPSEEEKTKLKNFLTNYLEIMKNQVQCCVEILNYGQADPDEQQKYQDRKQE